MEAEYYDEEPESLPPVQHTPPLLALQGSAETTVSIGSTFQDPGVVASATAPGAGGVRVVVSGVLEKMAPCGCAGTMLNAAMHVCHMHAVGPATARCWVVVPCMCLTQAFKLVPPAGMCANVSSLTQAAMR